MVTALKQFIEEFNYLSLNKTTFNYWLNITKHKKLNTEVNNTVNDN